MHLKLWHRGFWYVSLSVMLFTASVYMVLTVLPQHLFSVGYDHLFATVCYGAFIAGMYIPGGLVARMVQDHRRNWVCIKTVVALAALFALFYFWGIHLPALTIGICLLAGMLFGFAGMVMNSTLILDTCESFQRTEASHGAAWFSRLALAIGPFLGFLIYGHCDVRMLMISAAAVALLSALFTGLVKFPFRAPEELEHYYCLDRFFLVRGFPLYLNLLLITTAIGMVLSTQHTERFYLMMLLGFLIGILAEKYVFANTELKSMTVTGCVLIAAAQTIIGLRPESTAIMVAAVFCGIGIGIIGSRFLLFFIKLSKHCERGTSQSTFFLSWHTGLVLGLCLGYVVLNDRLVLGISFGILVTAFLIYNYVVHPWYMHNKNR